MSAELMRFRRELRDGVGKIVAFEERMAFGATLMPILEQVMRGSRVHDDDIRAAFSIEAPCAATEAKIAAALAMPVIIPAGKGGKATALVSMCGVALYKTEFQPYAYSTAYLAQTIRSIANDPEIGTIILEIDSPGGYATGVMEAADEIFAARQTTRVVAIVNPLCASAAYWLASQANEIISIPSGDIGSVGVFCAHAECSKMMDDAGIKFTLIYADGSPYKVEGNPFQPLADDAREYLKEGVNSCMADFAKAVARGRGVSVAKVLSDFGKGRVMLDANAAKAAGMIDRVSSIDSAYARWGVSMASMQGRRRGEVIENVFVEAEAAPEESAVEALEPVEVIDDQIESSESARRRLDLLRA